MALYLLSRKNGKYVGFDEYIAMLFRAATEERAREMANEICADEGQIWHDPTEVFALEIHSQEEGEELIISSFKVKNIEVQN